MDKIEERLRRLLGWQHQVVRMETGALPDADLASAYKYRDAHRDKIAADWQAREELVRTLELALEEAIFKLKYYINNPSAWEDGFNQNVSDVIEGAVNGVEATLARVGGKGG